MISRLLVANRGEIGCRIARAAAELGIETVGVYADDDGQSRHVELVDEAVALGRNGVAAYLDVPQLVDVAVANDCDALHPGYGFVSEHPDVALACVDAGLVFVGPTADTLAVCGDKPATRRLAASLDIPVLDAGPVDGADDVVRFVDRHGSAVIKAVRGGGGRGMRVVRPGDDAPALLDRCRSEAERAFGDPAVYVERMIPDARHLEVQIVGDGDGAVSHLWERECTLQRRHQKLVEYAPAPGLDRSTANAIIAASLEMAQALAYRSLGTFEFLLDRGDGRCFLIEANPRIQVEHTVTEAITGVDLVQAQLQLAGGASLADLGLVDPPSRGGQAIQVRINAETMAPDGAAMPATGEILRMTAPGGHGVRIETHAGVGQRVSAGYDSLLAKLVVHHPSPGIESALRRARRALAELEIVGVATNRTFVEALLDRPEVAANDISTRFIDRVSAEILAAMPAPASAGSHLAGTPLVSAGSHLAGTPLGSDDPLAVLEHGRTVDGRQPTSLGPSDADPSAVVAPMQGTIVSIDVAVGDNVPAGVSLLVMEAMKMEHVIVAPTAGTIRSIDVDPGQAVLEGHPLVRLDAAADAGVETAAVDDVDLAVIRPDLTEVVDRHGFGLDENRSASVARRHGRGKRTARENVADLVDDGSFVEWGPLVVAAQRRRRSLEDLIEQTPGDGLIGGVGTINRAQFGEDRSRCMVVTYDYMVLAGTQGHQNHRKKDRLFELAHRLQLPVVLFAEGGGGRPGDTDGLGVAGLDCLAFGLWGELSGHVPMVGINGGYCFAGNAALLGCCDVVIATVDSNVGMGGPAMIEGGGLGVYHPSEVGPIDEQTANGVVDIVVADEAEAVDVAKRYLSYFQGSLSDWTAADQRRLRHVVPENRLRIYDVREVVDTLFDQGSVLELRTGFGLGMVTALARIEGRPVGVIANNPGHLAGAITSDGADKAARFMQLCDAFGLPIVSLCDTPGIMVGPEAEKTGLVRHASRMFVVGANLEVPVCTLVLRKGYGLGAQAMAGGGFKSPLFTVAWPTGEFGGMGLEGAVKLGYRNELAAIDDPDERRQAYDEMVARMYEVGKAVSMADHFEIDDVIDPIESRHWISTALGAASATTRPSERPFIDTW